MEFVRNQSMHAFKYDVAKAAQNSSPRTHMRDEEIEGNVDAL
jgi:hypothetical protein